MTYILHHEAPARFETQSLVKSANRAAHNTLAVCVRAATGITRAIASTPAAISRAFASAYADPYQPKHSADDPADPRNF